MNSLKNKLASGDILTLVIFFGTLFTILYGWFMNIYTLIAGGYEATSTMLVGLVGVFVVPLGALTYFIAG
jgi:hypothetical protein